MEKLTEAEIRTLQLALDNMASDGVLDSGIKMLMDLHNKLDRIAAEQNAHLTLGSRPVFCVCVVVAKFPTLFVLIACPPQRR